MTKSDSPEQVNHVLQNSHPREMGHHQSSSQRRDEGWNEHRVVYWFWFALGIALVVNEFEVLQVLENPNKVYDLSARALRFPQDERVDRW